MTIRVEIPYASLLGDGTKVTFPFSYSLTEEEDLYVKVDGELQTEFSEYIIEDVTDDGGFITFAEAPVNGAVILIYRRTTKSQEIDYMLGEAFPLETHEDGFDKFMRILQELINGTFTGIGDDGEPFTLTFDLSVTQQAVTVTIVNSGGTDAVIPAWVSGETAGVYHGETVAEASVPADGSASTKPDGYVILGI